MRSPDWKPLRWRIGLVVAAIGILAIAVLHKPPKKLAGTFFVDRDAPSAPQTPAKIARVAGTYTAIGGHPIFEPSRQPWSPPKAPPVVTIQQSSSVVPPRGYSLVGLVMTVGQRAALLRDAGGRTRILSDGQMLDGWSVRSIDSSGVHLQADRQRFDLTMSKQGR